MSESTIISLLDTPTLDSVSLKYHTSEKLPLPEMVRVVLASGVDPNQPSSDGRTAWSVFLQSFQSTGGDKEIHACWQQVLDVFLDHGANIKQHSDFWMPYLVQSLERDRDDGIVLMSILQLLDKLLSHGMSPNESYCGSTVWLTFLKMLGKVLQNHGPKISWKLLLTRFLRCGADINRVSQTLTSLLADILTATTNFSEVINLIEVIRIMFQHGLDPNARSAGPLSLWEEHLQFTHYVTSRN